MPRLQIDRAEFAQRHAEGLTIAQLAEHFGISPRSVGNLRRELGLRSSQFLSAERLARIEAMLDDGWSFAEVQRTEGVHPETLRAHFPGRAWTPAQRVEFTTAKRKLERALRKTPFAA